MPEDGPGRFAGSPTALSYRWVESELGWRYAGNTATDAGRVCAALPRAGMCSGRAGWSTSDGGGGRENDRSPGGVGGVDIHDGGGGSEGPDVTDAVDG